MNTLLCDKLIPPDKGRMYSLPLSSCLKQYNKTLYRGDKHSRMDFGLLQWAKFLLALCVLIIYAPPQKRVSQFGTPTSACYNQHTTDRYVYQNKPKFNVYGKFRHYP
ncbi:hypothetical protein B9Q07_07260 [Candidatus Marsarchaeota G2 archaeon ECH_B_3]|uniref:Uncharacterized protein n=2 Tax=Candidatus Marsarchaeota group 2 TaxID=2203771 RepID=A0A2R6BT10_9ARCH|nr:MAG: hypothetical protein B9Q07_07260 [Candidatus Marsarchaeota G2 archaeon ECH_B_3]PSO01669.1 MAG: hypothetical protein B9Q05_08145 [Candidatus Marsarchaeota G2 archaeon ECH_B_1]